MTFDLHQILASKRTFRQALARRDIVEKLRLLDALHERALTLRPSRRSDQQPVAVSEDPARYKQTPPKAT